MKKKFSSPVFLFIALFFTIPCFLNAKSLERPKKESVDVLENKIVAFSKFTSFSTARETIFFEDFESSADDWLHGDMRETNGIQWHTDTFNAYSGKSWWCGHPDIGGYLNNWYQELTTPAIDLTNASNPQLTFVHYYGTEYDTTTSLEENPWDGCHVRISTDGGSTYQLISPEGGYDPPDSLYVWEYHIEQVENGMPGWHGTSDGWEAITFDLSQFSGNQIKLKFIFASDPMVDSRDNDEWVGWIIDNIEIKDGENVLFFDDGEDTVVPSQLLTSEGSGLYPQGWEKITSEYHSPTHSYNCEDDYNMANVLISPWIPLPETQDYLYLSYWIYADMPDFSGDGESQLEDYFIVEITSDGLTWEKQMHDYARSSIGADEGWVQITPDIIYNGSLDLDSYKGQDVKIRWLVITDNNDDGGSGAGLFLDDVEIYSEYKMFGPRQIISTECEGAQFVSACDLDNDGDMDVISVSGKDDKIAWYENSGDADFGDQQVITTSVNYPMTVHLGDLDGDGDLDLLTGSNITYNNSPIINYPGELVWIENQGQGTFSEPVIIDSTAYYPNTISVADLDGDGDLDALCASRKKLTWYRNDGSGHFGNEIEILSPLETSGAMQTADMDKDGDTDIIFSYPLPDGDNVFWLENEGDGSFNYYHVISSVNFSRSPDAIYVTDLDHDNDPDILGTGFYYNEDDQLVWFGNLDGSGFLWDSNVISTELDWASSVYAADLDHDGDNDVLTASREDDKIAWYANGGSGSFDGQHIITTDVDWPLSVFTADLDGDGDQDVLSASYRDNTIAYYENQANPTSIFSSDKENAVAQRFQLMQNYPNPFNPETTIQFSLKKTEHVLLNVFNIIGEKVATVVNASYPAGMHNVKFDGSSLPSGIYIYQIETETFSDTRKMMMLK